MEDAQRLQDLISSNALLDAFLGEPNTAAESTAEAINNVVTPTLNSTNNNNNSTNNNNNNNNNNNDIDDSNNKNIRLLNEKWNEIFNLINDIASSTDIDALVDGIATDLEYFVQHVPSTALMVVASPGELLLGKTVPSAGADAGADAYGAGSKNNNNSSINNESKFVHVILQPVSTTSTVVLASSTTTFLQQQDQQQQQQQQQQQPLPIQLQALVFRIARIKYLLYDESKESSSSSSAAAAAAAFTGNVNSKTSFIQQFLKPIIMSNSTNNNNNSNNNNNNNDINAEHAKRVLQSILKSKRNQQIIIPNLLRYLHLLPFEIRKNVSSIFNYLLVSSDLTVRMDFVFYVQEYFDCIMDCIIEGHFIDAASVGLGVGGDSITRDTLNNIDATATTDIDDETKDAIVVDPKNEQHNFEITATTTNNDNNVIVRTQDVVIHFGTMFRSIIRHPILYTKLVHDESRVQKYIFPFLDLLVNQPNFEGSSDAQETLHFVLHPIDMDIVLPFDISDDSSKNDNGKEGEISAAAAAAAASKNNGVAGTIAEAAISGDDTYEASKFLNNTKNSVDIDLYMEQLSATFLERYYASIFTQRFNPKLLCSKNANYITRRLCLQLLSSILLTRSNYNIMIRYVSSKSNLRTIMMLLRDPSVHITLDAFHVFKIFVANPNKPQEILRVLADNKVKLIKYLSGFHKEKEDVDGQFRDEKILVISTLKQLE